MPSLVPCRNCIIANDVQAHTICKNNLSVKWQREYTVDIQIARILDSFHKQNGSYSLNRAEIFACEDSFERTVKALWWGYPNGMRSHFHDVVLRLREMAEILHPHRNQSLDLQEFVFLYNRLNAFPNVGSATISKLHYYFGIFQDHIQCVIIDRFVRESMDYYDEFHPVHDSRPAFWYLEHARQINEVTIDDTTPEQIEFFLFSHRVY